MILQLQSEQLLGLKGARGMAIEIVDGHVWITEAGRAGDSFLEPGRFYRVAGDGLVLIGGATLGPDASRVDISVKRSLRAWLRERFARYSFFRR